MEALLKRQDEIAELINRIKINFKKDPLKRKTPAYLKTRQEALDNLWGEFESNHELLLPYKDNPFKYFVENVYEATLNLCEEVRAAFSSVLQSSSSKQVDQATEPCGEVDELIARQRTNFRAFTRLLKSIKVEYITENWELEDELRTIKSRWQIIDELHFKIDNILCGEDEQYEGEFSQHETLYKDMKRTLNQKLIAKVHQHQSTPKLEIPVFTGNYTQWPTFHDLFTEAIHNNSTLSKAQKMQHLKGKLKGEAERLIQHLHIAAENYDTAWEILLHRFSNHQILFTNQIEVFLNQPNVHKQTSFELKRLHDTSMECIHAIHNLGVDTSTWDPLLVHLISKKLDVQTYTDYKESRKSPRELPSLGEFMTFLECKFTALEPVQRKERENTSSTSSAPAKQPPYQYKNTSGKIPYKNYYQANSTSYISRCPLCNFEHELYRCKRFIAMSPETKLRAISKHKICLNCLYKHHDKTCNSTKRCKECNAEHNTLLHEAFANNVKSGYTQQSSSTPSKHNVNHVASPDEEILLTTILIQVQKSDGSYITLRALLDQGSQISLISENAAQILGLKRISYHASVSGIGTSSKQSKGMITMQCKSIYDDHAFSTQALIISTVINNLPNSSFERQGWSHLQHIKLADPEYNVSRPIDILFDASVYSDIIMSGLIKGPTQAPIAQQTKLGWVLSGNVRTFNCNVVINNLADIKKYWEIEDIQDKSSVCEADEKCEKFYQATTRRLESGRYEVAIPMKSGFEKQLGASQGKAIAQFKQIEQKLNKNPELSDAYKTFMREYEQLGHMRQVYTSTEPSCYLPHHGVLKLDSNTTKLRVVFNASSVTSSGSSLNDLMERGPNLQQDLLPLVLKWRQYKYVLVCDIEKMFRQIMVREEDQPLQSIVWRESSDIPIKHYHLTTLSYGFKASPYIAIRTLQQIGLDHAEKYPLAAEAAKSSFFMDDLLSGHDDIEQAKVLQQQLIQMFQAAGMNLRNKIYDPKSAPTIKYETPKIEEKKAAQVNVTVQAKPAPFTNTLLCEHSSMSHVTRVVAWILRFIAKSSKRHNAESSSALTSAELNNAEQLIVKEYQHIEYEEDITHLKKYGRVTTNSKLVSLNPFLDEHSILRVGGRLRNSHINASAKHPIILSSHSRLTELLINQAHQRTLHGGARLTLSYIRERFWIVSGIRTVKRQLRKCVKCRRFTTETHQQIMADLPAPRVTPSRPFTHTGIDFTGHVEVKSNKGRGIRTSKGYVAVFVCLATKAVHLELVSDLSTPMFLQAFHRFCNRHSTPSHCYSDNGTNFVGANRLLKREYQEIIQNINKDFFDNINHLDIQWHFNAPAWPSAGGLWESAVKSLKYHLKRVLGDQKLTYEEFTTLLTHVEACLNSRPLCALTEDPDYDHLTPGHFLVGGPILSRPQVQSDNISLPKRWQLIQAMNKQIWKCWSNDYLQQLQARSKWRTPIENIKKDDIVVIREDNIPPGRWAIGRVIEIHPGKDNHIRVVTLKTQGNIIKRPVSKLIILPVQNSAENTSDNSSVNANQHKNKQQPKGLSLKSLVCTMLFLFMTLLSTSSAQNNPTFNVTSLQESQGFYFDKISDMQFIRDRWKLVVFYNMSTYWQGIHDVKQYVYHIKELCDTSNTQYGSMTMQLEHEISEIEHYNTLLRSHNKRKKRGLINGVGYVANSLFGILDDNFAEQYEKDIQKITQNENHIQDLVKNQTLVLEAESNILHRNENIMKKQFSFIRNHIKNLTTTINGVRLDYNNTIYIMSSSLAIHIILTNLRATQNSLINMVTDISQGHIDSRLLSPEQLEAQLNIISRQLRGDLSLPISKTSIKDLYKLLRVFVRVRNDYLIMEVNIPLVNNELLQLDKIISMPQRKDNHTFYVIPALPYIAFNLRKDMGVLLSEQELQKCTTVSEEKILCSLEKPIYNLNIKRSLCKMNLIDSEANTPTCRSQVSTCSEKWIKLHDNNKWLYACCNECTVRIFCPAGVTIKTIYNNGIVDLGQGCTLKSDSFTIYAHNKLFNELNISTAINVSQQKSILNTIINTSEDSEFLPKMEDSWNEIQTKINFIKEQSSKPLSIHDIHHYALVYIILVITIVVGSLTIYWRMKRGGPELAASQQVPGGQSAAPPAPGGQGAPAAGREGEPAPTSDSVSEVVVSRVQCVSELPKKVNVCV
ncbi:unnamed protein product [Plutella xylostella]|nr:unnamed protein product [Plutella xylostella]